MELVYLWVEKYKNIEKQGFNFSPRFKCEYDGENLTINENKEYVSIFPENINITAIVGENGSGKSSLLVGITNHKAIFKIGNEYFSRSFDLEKINAPFEIKRNSQDILNHIVYVDFDLIKFLPMKDMWDYEYKNTYDRNIYKSIENSKEGDINFSIPNFIHNFYNLIMEHKASFESKLFFFNPQKIIFNDYLHEVRPSHPNSNIVNELLEKVSKHPFSKERFLLFLFTNKSWKNDSEFPIIKTIEDLSIYEEIIFKHTEHFKIENKQDIYSFFDALSDAQNKTQMLIEDFIPFYEKHKEAFLKLIKIAYLQINFRDTLQREYSDLSQGERKLFTEMLMIFNAIKKNGNNDIFVVLDEPDLTLHPEWQKKYINEMLKLLSNFSEKRFHFIITSHSPFILSDIPKENVIFLKSGKQDNPDIEQTFGANIHTLLSHGFFMDGGLMGEFAKTKINEVIEILQKQELSEDEIKTCKNIISIIGEPILQRTLEHQLNEKLNPNETELQKLEREQKEIQTKIDKLTGKNSETD
jgi:predicted ATPase